MSADMTEDPCAGGNDNNGYLGARISSVFVIGFLSWFGAIFPVWARRHQNRGMPEWAFFIAKYFGSGVIIATAFIHLLAPANEELVNDCAATVLPDYPWPEGIALIVVFLMFWIELLAMRYARWGTGDEENPADRRASVLPGNGLQQDEAQHEHKGSVAGATQLGADHLSHDRDHVDAEAVKEDWQEHGLVPESYATQLTSVFILEFGVIFHSVFIGLTLAVTGDDFNILYVVIVFHQTFEGLGLGSRLALVPWPKSKRWTPYILATAYGLTTPVAIAIGLGVRTTYNPESLTGLLVNGFLDAISAGILLYTGLVELMAHEFMFSHDMRKAPGRVVFLAALLMAMGAGLMALLGKWA